jgi:hypothetical protein
MSKTNKYKEKIELDFYGGDLSNKDLIEILQSIRELLQLKSVKEYAKEHGISVQGVYSCRKSIDFCTFKLVVDND